MSNSAIKNVLAFEQAVDRRLPAHYSSYHIGRLLLITGSVTLLSGLLLKFIFYEDRVGPIFIVTLIICGLGVALFLIGAFLIIFAARKSAQAQDEFAKQTGLNQPNNNYQSNIMQSGKPTATTPNPTTITTLPTPDCVNNNNNIVNNNHSNAGLSNSNTSHSTTRPTVPLGRSISQTLDSSMNSVINLQASSASTLERFDSNPLRH